ncbi:UNVERIFIED_CONTAM: hypothetical protein HDU68_000890 [Siphonaria sp. JEL0065]|nr:hypothetical protein HDU68_000890 [Siphonaria sp. JEL0065]
MISPLVFFALAQSVLAGGAPAAAAVPSSPIVYIPAPLPTTTQILYIPAPLPPALNGSLFGKISGATVCVDIFNLQTANGTPIIAWTCNNQPNQHWAWHPTQKGAIYNPSTGKCLDRSHSGDFNGAVVDLWDCFIPTGQTTNLAQVWTFNTDGTLKSGSRCLKVQGAGNQLVMWDCNTTDASEKFHV